MIQCKLCGTPLDDNDDKLLEHWKAQHIWHWTNHKDLSPRNAILKKR